MFTKTKRMLGLLLALVMMFSVTALADTANIEAGYDMVSVRVDGTYINAPSYLYNNYVYVPLRAVTEAMGAEVLWNGETKTITITTNAMEPKTEPRTFAVNPGEDVSFEAHVNYVNVFINGNEKMAPHFLYNGTTYVPVSVFPELFECHVMQHLDTKSVRIYSPDYKTFGEDEVFYVNDTAFTKAQVKDISTIIAGNPNPATYMDYVYVEEYVLAAVAIKALGDEWIPKDGFEAHYTKNDYDALMKTYGVSDKEAFITNVAWPFYYSENLNHEALIDQLNITDEDLADYLPSIPYGQGRWLKAKHILIEKTEDGSGLKQAEEILAFLKENPEKFDSMMATYSADPGSIAQPEGYLFTEGDMIDEFYEGTLPLQIGEISDIVESDFGYHIILKVADYENGVPLEEVKEEVKSYFVTEAVNNLFVELMSETDTVMNHAVIEEK